MPSEQANRVIQGAESLTQKELTARQKLQCEELVYNVFTGPICRYIGGFATSIRKGNRKRPKFETIYFPIINGAMVNAERKKGAERFFFDTVRKEQVYARCHMYLGDNFSAVDLDAIVWMAKYATPTEVQTAINAAAYKGVRNASYVRAVIIGNRRRATAELAALNDKYKKITNEKPNINIGVPDIKSLKKAWQRKLKDAIERERTTDAEREGSKKIDL